MKKLMYWILGLGIYLVGVLMAYRSELKFYRYLDKKYPMVPTTRGDLMEAKLMSSFSWLCWAGTELYLLMDDDTSAKL